MGDWANLFPELLDHILRRLPVDDGIRCAAVCSGWITAVRYHLHPCVHRPPWLMLPSASSSSSADFFSVTSGKLHKIRLPNPPIADRLCIGSSAGFLVTVNARSEILIVNPITGAQFALPSICTLSGVSAVAGRCGELAGYRHAGKTLAPDAIRHSLFNKAVVSWGSDGQDSADPTVVLLLASPPALAFAGVGDEVWTPVQKSIAVHDVVFHKGVFYSIDVTGRVESWNFSYPFPTAIVVMPDLQSHGIFVDKYLVESMGKLLQVWRMAGSIKVFKLDEQKHQWVELESIHDQVLFLGNNHSLSLSSRDFPELRGNCIYFTETSRLFPQMGCGNWVYSLEDASTTPCYPCDNSGLDWSLPIWIMPCLS